jgi:hypothetical protein
LFNIFLLHDQLKYRKEVRFVKKLLLAVGLIGLTAMGSCSAVGILPQHEDTHQAA